MNKYMTKLCNPCIIWLTGGIVYFYMEIAFRGYSHFSMFICGGLCFLFVGFAGRKIVENSGNVFAAVMQIMIMGSLIITSLEYITGIIVNVYLKINVWDYSDMRYNVQGQICMAYSMLWALLSLPCVFLDGVIRKYIFEE